MGKIIIKFIGKKGLLAYQAIANTELTEQEQYSVNKIAKERIICTEPLTLEIKINRLYRLTLKYKELEEIIIKRLEESGFLKNIDFSIKRD